MDFLFNKLTDWLKGMLADACMDNLSGLFDTVNSQVGKVSDVVGMTPSVFSPEVFQMIRNISETVIIPIAAVFVLAFFSYISIIRIGGRKAL